MSDDGNSNLTFYVGERPIEPVVVVVDPAPGEEADNDRDLTGLTVSLIGDELPAHTIAVEYPIAGQMAIEFIEAFTDPGVYTVQVKLTSASGDTDISGPFTVTVLDLASASRTLVTPGQAELMTGVAVSQGEVDQAQGLIALAAARDLTDQAWLAGVSPSDEYWLRVAIAYQAAKLAAPPTSADDAPDPPGIQRTRTCDQSEPLATGTETTESLALAETALIALRHITWMRPARTLHAVPFLAERPQPSRWQPLHRAST